MGAGGVLKIEKVEVSRGAAVVKLSVNPTCMANSSIKSCAYEEAELEYDRGLSNSSMISMGFLVPPEW